MTFEFIESRCKCPNCHKKLDIILKPQGNVFYTENFMVRPEYELFCTYTLIETRKQLKR